MGLILSKINEVPYLNIEYGKYKIELLILFFKVGHLFKIILILFIKKNIKLKMKGGIVYKDTKKLL